MDKETLRLLTDLHIHNHRQGPGSKKAFMQMLTLSHIDTKAELEVVDIGSGTGSATIPLLQKTKAKVTAVELLPAFLQELRRRAAAVNVTDRVTVIEADMAALPFQDEQFDVIWSEGAIYNIGFEKGVQEWRRFLKPGGVIVLSEITWLATQIPEPLRTYWEREYPGIDTASNKIAVLEQNSYTPIGYFPLTPECWLENYYEPLQVSFSDFLTRHNNSDSAQKIIAAEENEIALYKQYKDFYSYGVYIAKKI